MMERLGGKTEGRTFLEEEKKNVRIDNVCSNKDFTLLKLLTYQDENKAV